MPPIIGITCKTETKIEDYKNAIDEFGGEPRVLISRPGAYSRMHSLRLTGFSCQGVVTLTLAVMMNPGIMLRVLAKLEALANRAIRWSYTLCQKALEADIPVFGICRGIQVMSVATGGNLYQDIHTQLKNLFAS